MSNEDDFFDSVGNEPDKSVSDAQEIKKERPVIDPDLLKHVSEGLKGDLKKETDETAVKDIIKKQIEDNQEVKKTHNYTPGVSYDLGQTKSEDNQNFVAMPAGHDKQVEEALLTKLGEMIGVDTDDIPGSTKDWIAGLNNGAEAIAPEGLYNKALEKNHWTQEGICGPRSPQIGKPSNAEVDGADFLLLAVEASETGKYTQIPLDHSGFYINIRPPTQPELMLLIERLNDESIELGRSSYGLSFSNQKALITKTVIKFAMSLMVSTTKATVDRGALSKVRLKDIDLFDIPALLGGTLRAIFPNGMEYTRPCLGDSGNCEYVYEGKLDVPWLYYKNKDLITDYQLNHMTKTVKNTMEASSITKYITDLPLASGRTIVLSDKIKVRLKRPNIEEYFNSRDRWSEEVSGYLEKALMEGVDTVKKKEEYLERFMSATSAGNFGHFVDRIDVDSNFSTNRKTIDEVLNKVVSADNKMLETFIDGVKEFMDDSIIAVYGIPAFLCPTCNSNSAEEESKEAKKQSVELDYYASDWLLPIEMVNVFILGVYLSYLTRSS
jgi:hypothetical protein